MYMAYRKKVFFLYGIKRILIKRQFRGYWEGLCDFNMNAFPPHATAQKPAVLQKS